MSVHKDEKRNTWYFKKRIKNIEGKIVNATKRGFKTKAEAKKAETLFDDLDSVVNRLTFNDIYEKYLLQESKTIKESTIYSKSLIIKKYILKYFENQRIKDISNDDVTRWHEELKKQNLCVRRLNKIHCELKALFEYTEKFYKINNNPARVVGGFKDNSRTQIHMEIWTAEEFSDFIKEVESPIYKMLFYILYYTGLRKGEALALTWKDIDITNQKISINKTLTNKYNKDLKSDSYIVTSPKTSSSNRMVDIPSKLSNMLAEYKTNLSLIYGKIKDSNLVFGINKPLPLTTIDRQKKKACKLSNVKEIRIHDFRHSHASLLIAMNINPLFISERLGHKNVSTTLDTYSHLFPTNQKEIVLKLNDIMEEI